MMVDNFTTNSEDSVFKAFTVTEYLETELLLETVYRISGYDFRNYLRNHIERRIKSRMLREQLPTITMLLNKIIHEPLFIHTILSDFSIQVTEMFRDPAFFLAFRKNVVPQLHQYSNIYIWHAGCSTGEEAFSMAILLREEGLLAKSKIYATDISQEVIEKAKQGIIPLRRMKAYTQNYLLSGGQQNLSVYYHTDEKHAYISPYLLDSICFEKHNLTIDGSFQSFHIILCRNVMIYFNAGLKERVHRLFLESIGVQGFLCLGSKESLKLNNIQNVYRAFDQDGKIYQKI
jgi:chemotaxis protein methyltransferase CheR